MTWEPRVLTGLVLVGFPSELTLITLHQRVLHLSPNWPYVPSRIGITGRKDNNQVIAGTNLQAR